MWIRAVVCLTGLLAAAGLATSRFGLIAHELGGHGGAAVALGGGIRELRLFWFAGGWIRYDFETSPGADGYLLISLAGIAVELVIGMALWLVLRREDRLSHRIVRGVGGAFVIHAGWYLATGIWHGYGDGQLAYRAAGAWRYPIAIVAGLATCVAAVVVARLVIGALAAGIPGGRRGRIAGVVVAAVAAAGLQLGLAVAELRIRGDSTYGAIMTPERDRVVARELAAWQREQAQRGAQIDEAERAAEQRRLAARHREPPFAPVLAVLLVVAVAFGAACARPPVDPLGWPLVARALAIAGGSILAVITTDLLFR